MINHFEENKKIWNDRVAVHLSSDFYDVKGFKEGKSSLNFIEIEELGDVNNKSILHLQCHFGLDSLSLARMGARVTGADFSDEGIKAAKKLNEELNLDAEFLCTNVYDLRKVLDKKFDIVFTSYGVIGWLPDLNKWADIISYFLKPAGVFFMVEFHPFVWMLDEKMEFIKYSYFNTETIAVEVNGTYTDPNAPLKGTEYGWNHSFSEVLSSLISNGLTIKSFTEYPFSVYNCFPDMVRGKDEWWRIKGLEDKLPLMYSVKAVKK